MRDIQFVYDNAWRKFKALIPCLAILILAMAAYELISSGLERLFMLIPAASSRGMAVLLGFVRWLVKIMLMAHLAGLLNRATRYGKLTFSDLAEQYGEYRVPLSQVFFILYLVELATSMFVPDNIGYGYIIMITLVWMALTAPAFEAVYIGGENGNTFISALIGLWQTNGITLLPIVILGGAGFLALQWIAASSILLNTFFELRIVLMLLLKAILGAAFMLFRSVLFREVYFSNPRSREFKRRTM